MRPFRLPVSSITAALVASFVLVALSPGVAAHGAPSPLEIETYVLLDEAEDAWLVVDGYDLYDLYVREAHWGGEEMNGTFTDGLIFRFSLYGGFGAAKSSDSQTIEIGFTGPAGEQSFRLTTKDDQTWTGDMEIVEISTEADITPGSWLQKIQAIVPYAAFNATVGDSISGIWMKSYVDDDVIDVAPGTYYPPRGGETMQVPHGESVRFVEELPLRGPIGYTNTTVSGDNGTIEFMIQNPMQGQGQHLHIEVADATGWRVGEPQMESPNLPAGNNTTVRLPAVPLEGTDTPILVYIGTDVGGLEPVFVGMTGDGAYNGARDVLDVQMDFVSRTIQESPSLPLAPVALLGLVGLIGLRRRH